MWQQANLTWHKQIFGRINMRKVVQQNNNQQLLAAASVPFKGIKNTIYIQDQATYVQEMTNRQMKAKMERQH